MTDSQRIEMERLMDNGVLDAEVVSDVEAGRVDRRWVYLMESAGLYKIGYARRPKQRLSSINCGSPTPVVIIWQTETDQFTHIERLLHAKFKDKHKHGEWFALDPADVRFIRASSRLPILLNSAK